MTKKDFLKILEEIPTGLSKKITIGENDYALKLIQVDQPKATMRDIEEYNIEAKGWGEGFENAIEKIKDWRSKKYLELR